MSSRGFSTTTGLPALARGAQRTPLRRLTRLEYGYSIEDLLQVDEAVAADVASLLPAEADIGSRIARHCQSRGVIVRPIAHLNVMSPPLVLTRRQIDTMVQALHESICETMDELTREGLWND